MAQFSLHLEPELLTLQRELQSGELERGAAVGILLVVMISIMALIARRLGTE